MSDPAHVLFPNDAPAGSAPPEWFKADQAAATARLMGAHKPAADDDDAAARMFPADAPKNQQPPKAAAPDADAAEKLFPDDANQFDEKPIAGFFNSVAVSAAGDGDSERAQALNAAGEALIADARRAGTSAAEFASALDIIRERQGDLIAPITDEKLEADFASGMEAVRSEFGATADSDLKAAQAFIRDLDKVAPGTMDSLNRTGAGNDMRLIRAAIKEAKRRGYR